MEPLPSHRRPCTLPSCWPAAAPSGTNRSPDQDQDLPHVEARAWPTRTSRTTSSALARPGPPARRGQGPADFDDAFRLRLRRLHRVAGGPPAPEELLAVHGAGVGRRRPCATTLSSISRTASRAPSPPQGGAVRWTWGPREAEAAAGLRRREGRRNDEGETRGCVGGTTGGVRADASRSE